jgi:hypothetical protein
MDIGRVTYRLVENIQKIVLDHGDEIAEVRKSLKELKSYFSPKMLIIYFSFILTQVIGITYWVSKQETTIALLTRELEELKQQSNKKNK